MSDEKPTQPKTPPKDTKPAGASGKPLSSLSDDVLTREESKTQQLLRSFLRWAGLALIVFGLGAFASYFLFTVPKNNALKLANQDTATAEAQITSLQGQITTLEDRIDELSILEETNQTLQAELDSANAHILLLDAFADVRAAQFALASNNSSKAEQELSGTADTLTAMKPLLEAEQTASIDSMLQRLTLALGGLASDPFAAQSDLEVLANNLLQLETSLFGTP